MNTSPRAVKRVLFGLTFMVVMGFLPYPGAAVGVSQGTSQRKTERNSVTKVVYQGAEAEALLASRATKSPRLARILSRTNRGGGATGNSSNLLLTHYTVTHNWKTAKGLKARVWDGLLAPTSVHASSSEDCDDLLPDGPIPKPIAHDVLKPSSLEFDSVAYSSEHVSAYSRRTDPCDLIDEVYQSFDSFASTETADAWTFYGMLEVVGDGFDDISEFSADVTGEVVEDSQQQATVPLPMGTVSGNGLAQCGPNADTWHGIPCTNSTAINNEIWADSIGEVIEMTLPNIIVAAGGCIPLVAGSFAMWLACSGWATAMETLIELNTMLWWNLLSYWMDCVANITTRPLPQLGIVSLSLAGSPLEHHGSMATRRELPFRRG